MFQCDNDFIQQLPRINNLNAHTFPSSTASAGLIITEGTIISENAMGWAWAPRIYTEEHVEGWKKVTAAVHESDGKIFCQLWHMGRVTHSTFHGLQPVGPSAVIANGEGTTGGDLKKHPYECPRELSVDDIKKVVEEWRHAAQCAKDAGFDGVEIHAANGYFVDIFLSVRYLESTCRLCREKSQLM